MDPTLGSNDVTELANLRARLIIQPAAGCIDSYGISLSPLI
jgi:hypothetical protein